MRDWIKRVVLKIGLDKIAHFFGCAFLTLAFGHFFNMMIAAAVVLTIGIIKEVIDGVFDWKDLLADALGIAAATIIQLLSLVI